MGTQANEIINQRPAVTLEESSQRPAWGSKNADQPVTQPGSASSYLAVSTPVIGLCVGSVLVLVLALGILLGRTMKPLGYGAVGGAAPTSASVSNTTGNNRGPDSHEVAALQQARNSTGSTCWLMWSGGSYDVMCATPNNTSSAH